PSRIPHRVPCPWDCARRPQAIARGAILLCPARFGDHGLERQELACRDSGLVARTLRAIGAVLRAAARLDAEQGRKLDPARIEMRAMHALRAEDELGEGER